VSLSTKEKKRSRGNIQCGAQGGAFHYLKSGGKGFVTLSTPKPSAPFETFWYFAAERHNTFLRRLQGQEVPWSCDPIIANYRFTNAYRACDRVSQFLIKNVIYSGNQDPVEIFFRTLLFKMFNRIETWLLLLANNDSVSLDTFSFERSEETIARALEDGKRIFSAAYIMPPGSEPRKHQHYLKLLKAMIEDNLPEKLLKAPSMSDAFLLLTSYNSIGKFLGYQFITDLNYGPHYKFSEMEFVVAGPGALSGIKKCFSDPGDMSPDDIIRWVCDKQEEEFTCRGLSFTGLWGRSLQLIDCQNLFCEVDKYCRVKHPDVTGLFGRTRIKQRFSAKSEPLQCWFPPKWGINHSIMKANLHGTS
jgi:hypothetical protein